MFPWPRGSKDKKLERDTQSYLANRAKHEMEDFVREVGLKKYNIEKNKETNRKIAEITKYLKNQKSKNIDNLTNGEKSALNKLQKSMINYGDGTVLTLTNKSQIHNQGAQGNTNYQEKQRKAATVLVNYNKLKSEKSNANKGRSLDTKSADLDQRGHSIEQRTQKSKLQQTIKTIVESAKKLRSKLEETTANFHGNCKVSLGENSELVIVNDNGVINLKVSEKPKRFRKIFKQSKKPENETESESGNNNVWSEENSEGVNSKNIRRVSKRRQSPPKRKVYRGKGGGLYVLQKSKKTGRVYKRYIS